MVRYNKLQARARCFSIPKNLEKLVDEYCKTKKVGFSFVVCSSLRDYLEAKK